MAGDRQRGPRRQRGGKSTVVRGKRAEESAVIHLRARGYQIVERNFRCRLGELDIVARDGQTLVFVEVRSRRDRYRGGPIETVNAAKQRRLARVATFYLGLRRPSFETCRFDVVGIVGDQIQHITDAFRLGLYG